jgi:chemotaxis protein MotB
MPEGPDGKTIIIIKKVSGHGVHHGGAWKVAYADFVTAMMALFMVLWLVNSAAEPTRERIASYFRKPGIFQKGSGNPMEMGGGGILPDVFAPPADGTSQIQVSDRIYMVDAASGRVRELYDEGQGSKEHRYAPKVQGDDARGLTDEELYTKKEDIIKESDIERTKLEQLKTEIVKAIEQAGAQDTVDGVLGDVEIKIDNRGLVIEIMDTEKSSMFHSGQAVILGDAERKLLEIANILKTVPNPIDIEGHTDAKPFRGTRNYDNWNLSTDRANAARRVLEKAGLEKGQIARVVGYAAERPRDLDNPLNPANRRITISMRYTDRVKEALKGTQAHETSAKKRKVVEEIEQKADAASTDKPPIESSDFVEIGPQLPEQPREEESDEKGLKVEVSAVVPEGAVVESGKQQRGGGKKDLIFDSPSSFFKK